MCFNRASGSSTPSSAKVSLFRRLPTASSGFSSALANVKCPWRHWRFRWAGLSRSSVPQQQVNAARSATSFANHDRLIASIATLKMRPRITRLQEARAWDLVVFDEAHHLTASPRGTKVEKTDNSRLAEVLKGHSRDLLLLSATPH